MNNYKNGDKLTVNALIQQTNNHVVIKMHCKVVGVYPKFYVMYNGIYRFCGFKDDVHNGAVIAV